MKKQKRFTAIACTVMIAVTSLLGGCSAGTTASQSPAVKEENHEPVTLKLITWSETYGELYEKFHKKYPWITIEPVNPGGGDKQILEKIAALAAAGTPADLTWVGSDLLSYNQNGLLEDLKPYMEADPLFKQIKLPENYFRTMELNGKRLAVPFVDVPMWILVNKDLLAKHGVEMPKNDWTYDDFREIAKKVSDPAAGEYGLTTTAEFMGRLLPAKAVADGYAPNLSYMNAELTQSLLHTPDILNEVRWLQEFVTKDGSWLTSAKSKELGGTTNKFINGKTAFDIGGDWVLPGLAKDAKFQWDVLPFPKGKQKQVTFHIYGPLALLSGSKHKNEAYKWISFQFEQEAQKWKIDQGANASIIDPQLTAYIEQSPLWKGKNVEGVKLTKDMPSVAPGPTIPAFSDYNWVNSVVDVVFNAKDVNSLIPLTEQWNKKTLEMRSQLGLK
jgi:multiple sugar transport system substrate-binding protein